MGYLLRVENLEKSFEKLKVLDGINLSVGEGERVAILGPSGCGKTTLLKIIARLEREDSGVVERNFRSIGFVFQSPNLIPWLTVIENLLFVKEDVKKALEILEMVGLSGFEDYFPRQLSGGMRQRVNLARALMVDPDLILFDEPFSSLDFHIKRRLIDEILALQKEKGFSSILVTHDPFEALRLSEKILVLSEKPSRIVDVLETSKCTFEDVVLSLERATSMPP